MKGRERPRIRLRVRLTSEVNVAARGITLSLGLRTTSFGHKEKFGLVEERIGKCRAAATNSTMDS